MTVRRALVTKSDEAIKEFTNSDRDQIHRRIARTYADNPSVFLEVVALGGNLTPAMADTRYRSGAKRKRLLVTKMQLMVVRQNFLKRQILVNQNKS